MKKTKLFISFALFCIVLSFFSMALADSTKKVELVNAHNMNKPVEDGGASYSDNLFSIDYEGSTIWSQSNDVVFKVNQTGVYSIRLKSEGGGYSSDYKIYTGEWSKTEQIANIAAYKNGDSYELFSPTSSKTDTTVDVVLYAGQEYTITNLDSSRGRLSIFFSEAKNKKEWKESEYSSYLRTKFNNTNPGNHSTPNPIYSIPSTATVKIPDAEKGTVEGEVTQNLFEKYFVKLLLSVGDFALKLLGDIVGSDVTITKIIYNGASEENKIPALNPNLFDASNRSALAGIDIAVVINDWFDFFRVMAFMFYIVTILGIGIHILINSTGQGMAKAKSLFLEWGKGVLLLILIPLAIKYLFQLNEALVKEIWEKAAGTIYGNSSINFTDGSEWSLTAIEFRSPEYVSRYTGSVALGSDDATITYINNMQTYKDNFDLMRICRAYAGATWKLGYTIIWYILIGQLIVFVVMYYKRYFTILFLIAAFPVICIFHSISLMRGMNKAPEISNWFKKLTEEIFTQTIHAIIYAIITGTCMALFKDSIQNGGSINWLLIIIAINFVPEGEKILKRILSKIGGSGGIAESAKGIKGAVGRVAGEARKMLGMKPPAEK